MEVSPHYNDGTLLNLTLLGFPLRCVTLRRKKIRSVNVVTSALFKIQCTHPEIRRIVCTGGL